MADTLTTTTTVSTVPNGTVIGTDEVTIGGTLQHVQRIKLVDGADGGTALIGGDATNGLDVDVTRVSGTVTVTGSGGTFPVTDSGGSLTVDNGGTFAVQATIAAGATSIAKAEDTASADLDVGVPALAVRKATPANTSGTDGDYEFLQMSAGRLWTSSTIDAALPAGTNAIGKLAANTGVTIGAVEIASSQTLATVTTVSTVTSVTAIGTSVTPGTSAAHLGKAEDAAAASGDTGVAVWAVRRDAPVVSSGTAGDYSEINISGDGGVYVQAIAATVGGATPAMVISGASTNATSLKASAGQVYGVQVFNINAAVRYLKFYNKASAPTVGTDTPIKVLTIPGSTTGGGIVLSWPTGIVFGTGIAWALTTGVANSDTGAVAANEIVVNIDYK